jgi:L-lactate utilization protein LutB
LDIEIKNSIIKRFKGRNIEVSVFDTIREAKEQILELIPETASVGIGHSATLEAMKLTALLCDRGNRVYDKTLADSREESKHLKRQALLADWYVSGANAVSMEGHIVNMDHSGNRVAALSYGPEHVIIAVGINKLTSNLEEAIRRVQNTASPKNADRGGYNPPCIQLGACIDCDSEQRICHNLSIIQGQHEKHRMKLFIINAELGF